MCVYICGYIYILCVYVCVCARSTMKVLGINKSILITLCTCGWDWDGYKSYSEENIWISINNGDLSNR